MITIGEYVAMKQPKVYGELMCWATRELYFVARVQRITGLRFGVWKRLMEERPKPGLGGLLSGEKMEHISVGVGKLAKESKQEMRC